MAYDTELADRIRELVMDLSEVTRKRYSADSPSLS